MPAPGVRLHVEDAGEGPALILLHGFAGSARNFGPQVRELRSDHRVVSYDARGHGRSEAPPDPEAYSPEAFVDDIERVVAAAGEERVTLGGLSMGAGLALRYAIAHPNQLRGLVLAAFPPPGSAASDGWAIRFAEAIDRLGLEEAGRQFVWGGDRFDDRSAALIRQGYLEHAPLALSAILRRVLAVQPSVAELTADLANVDVPTLVVVGEKDFSSIDPSRVLARSLPRAELSEIAGAGHVVNLQKPESFNGVLRDFLRRIEEPGDA